MDFQGKVIALGAVEQINDTVKKQTVVVEEMSGQYPQSMAVDFLNERTSELNNVKVGDIVTLSVNFRTNESKKDAGRHFTSINGWKVTKIAQALDEKVAE